MTRDELREQNRERLAVLRADIEQRRQLARENGDDFVPLPPRSAPPRKAPQMARTSRDRAAPASQPAADKSAVSEGFSAGQIDQIRKYVEAAINEAVDAIAAETASIENRLRAEIEALKAQVAVLRAANVTPFLRGRDAA